AVLHAQSRRSCRSLDADEVTDCQTKSRDGTGRISNEGSRTLCLSRGLRRRDVLCAHVSLVELEHVRRSSRAGDVRGGDRCVDLPGELLLTPDRSSNGGRAVYLLVTIKASLDTLRREGGTGAEGVSRNRDSSGIVVRTLCLDEQFRINAIEGPSHDLPRSPLSTARL